VSELHNSTETAEPAALAQEADDSSGYDQADLGAEYDGDLEALIAADLLPARQQSRASTWGDSPQYDHLEYGEAGLGGEDDGDLGALTAADQLPARQDSRAATWGDNPVYDDEADLGAEYDGDLEALTTEDRTRDAAEDHAQGNSPPETGARDGSGDEAADRLDQDGKHSLAQPHVTHYQASFRGEQLDLWTDGQGHWASDYQRADDALPVDHLADVRSRMGPEELPATEWADGHAIEVTRDPKDGVWIPGLPGDMPDQAGDVLAASKAPEEQRSRSRDLLGELTRETEDVFDETKEVSDDAYKLLHHPPEGKAEVPVPAHGPWLESTPHETEIGGMATGVLAAALVVCMVGQKVHEWRTRRTGEGHASDG
jgi:hypothetical protein